jgi:hypothetical protein
MIKSSWYDAIPKMIFHATDRRRGGVLRGSVAAAVGGVRAREARGIGANMRRDMCRSIFTLTVQGKML